MAKTPRITAIDAHVGNRIRIARMGAGISQGQLGKGLGISFQQVQKYELGTNRVGAGRLHAIARILSLPESYFFEDIDTGEAGAGSNPAMKAVAEAIATEEGIRIILALSRIKPTKTRRRLAELLEEIAGLIHPYSAI